MSVIFRSFGKLLLAIFLILAIELTVFLMNNYENLLRTIKAENILEMSFFKKEAFTKKMISVKNFFLLNQKSDILIVGDSSGLYGLKPSIIDNYFKNHKTINSSITAEISWNGHREIADYYLKNNKNIKYLIFHFSAYGLPKIIEHKFSNELNENIESLYSHRWKMFYNIPSLYFRKDFVNLLYYKIFPHQYLKNFSFYEGFLNNSGVNQENIASFFDKEKGWLPLYDKMNDIIPVGNCGKFIVEDFINLEDNILSFRKELQKIKKFANNHPDLKVALIFNPVACNISDKVMPFVNELEHFKKNNPNIFIPYGYIKTYDLNYFYDRAHFNNEGAEIYSNEIAKKLIEFIDK